MKKFPIQALGMTKRKYSNFSLQYTIILFSVHKRKVHNIGKPIDDVTPRGPNLKLRKRYQQMQNQEEEFDKLTEDNGTYRPPAKVCHQVECVSQFYNYSFQVMRMDNSEEEDFDDEGLEGIDLEDEQDMGSRTIQVGDKNFTFSFA